MAIFYGSDSACISDVGLYDEQITDPHDLIGQRVARRFQTRRSGLAAINDDPDGGLDVRQFVLARVSPARLGQAEAQVSAEAVKDEQVKSAKVTFNYAAGVLVIQLDCTSSAGPFLLTLNVDALTVSAVVTF